MSEKNTEGKLTDEALDYASDVRWLELAQGAAFTIIDRQMLGELHRRASIAWAIRAALQTQGAAE